MARGAKMSLVVWRPSSPFEFLPKHQT